MDFNIVELNDNLYALPLASVLEVLDPGHVTPLPFSPDYIDGLINAGGKVIVQHDLSVQLQNGEPIPPDCGQLIVIESSGERIALHVERAVVMTSIAETDIRKTKKKQASLLNIKIDTLAGEFRWQNKTVLILSEDLLGLGDIDPAVFPEGSEGFVQQHSSEGHEKQLDQTKDVAQRAYMVIGSGNECYALPMENVCFVEDLNDVTRLPQAPSEVLGMIYTRNQPLLALGLDQLMGGKAEPSEKLVVVQYKEFRCALAVNRILGIKRLALKKNHEILAKEAELEGYLLGENDSLIGVVSLKAIFSHPRIQSLEHYLVVSNLKEQQKQSEQMFPLLTFRVGREQCALPLDSVKQVVTYQTIEKIPEGGGDHLHGMVEIHGAIYPVIDLRIELKTELDMTSLCAYIVASVENSQWAILVDQVNRVLEIPEKELELARTQDRQNAEAIVRIGNSLVRVISLASMTEKETSPPESRPAVSEAV